MKKQQGLLFLFMYSQKRFLDKFTVMLRHLRESSGLSQGQVSDSLKIGLRSYQRYESGESVPSLDVIFLLSKVLNFELKNFFAPEDLAKKIPDFRLFKDETEFREDSEVDRTGLFDILSLPQFIEAMDSEDLRAFRKISKFYESPYALSISKTRQTLINQKAKKSTGVNNDLVSTSAYEDPKVRGIIWATLMDYQMIFFEQKAVTDFPKGPMLVHQRGIFLNRNNNYFVIAALEFQTHKSV